MVQGMVQGSENYKLLYQIQDKIILKKIYCDKHDSFYHKFQGFHGLFNKFFVVYGICSQSLWFPLFPESNCFLTICSTMHG